METKTQKRTQLFNIFLTPDEHELLKERAKQENMSMAEYVRYSIMVDSFFSGNNKALKILAKGFSVKFIGWFNNTMENYKASISKR